MEKSYKETDGLLQPPEQSDVPVRLCLSYRLLVTLLCMASLITCFAAQSSMGSTMVCMVVEPDTHNGSSNNNDDITDSPVVMETALTTATPLPEQKYRWNKETQGWIHSSFFIGYYVTQLPSGILATRYGGRRVAIFGLFASAVAQLITPVAASLGVVYLCVVRAMCGFASGFVYSPTFAVLANWVPAAESSMLFGLAGTGMELGAVISFSLSSLVCEMDVIGGWPLAYYVMGAIGILTAVVFSCLVSDLPSQNRWMSRDERHYIEDAIYEAGGHGHKDTNDNSPSLKIPVSAILRSPAVWAIVVAQLGSDWLYYLLITVMPDFMAEVMHMSHTMVTLMSGLPFLTIIPSIYVAGSLADYLRRHHIMSTTAVRKTGDFLCKIFPGAILIIISYLGPGQAVTMAVLYVLGLMLLSFIYVSWITNPVDLSPAYTGFITSLCECGSMWIAIVVPIIVENITKDKKVSQWRLVFYITGGLQVVTFLFYLAFGSSVLQPWGRPDGAPHGDVSSNTESGDQPPLAGSSYVRRKRLRRSLSCPYASDGEIGRLRTYRAQRSFMSDTEDDFISSVPAKTKSRDSGKAVVYDCVYHHHNASASQEREHKPLTSDTETAYVTMYGSVSAYETAKNEDVYENMELDAGSETRPLASSGPTKIENSGVYENVIATQGSHDNSGAKGPMQPSIVMATSGDCVFTANEERNSIQCNGKVH